ncbi:MAG: agmatinase, partial [Oscillospiraceae bacterium]|nr:agmatinase [Oscillospiraceae bacterium]
MSKFIGCNKDFDGSGIIIFGAPSDGTASYRPGSRFAPAAIRNESYSIETYSPYLDRDLGDIKFFDAGDIELCFGNTEKILSQIEEFTKEILDKNKLPVMLGGEHLVTLGAVRAAFKKYPDLNIIHFDAHADMRDNYLGEKLSHATVMRRCHDLVGDNKIYQFGIRSGEREEFIFCEEHNFINKFNFKNLEETLNKIKNKPVYFTIDLDILDPADLPGTGTPEAGGVRFCELLTAVSEVLRLNKNIAGIDITELSPPYDSGGQSTSLACKLLR